MAKAKRLKRTGQKIDKVSGRFGSFYKRSFLKAARLLGEAGKTDSEAAEYFEVTDRTIRNWKLRHPEFAEALRVNKAIADDRVEASVYQMALGFYVDAEEIKVINGEIVRVQTRKFYPPSEIAALAWLNNRRRETWQRNPEPEIEAPQAEIEEIDINPDNVRQIARRFALTLVKGDKVA